MIDKKKPLLVLDASLPGATQVGVFLNKDWLQFEQSSKEPLQSIFFLAEKVLRESKLTIDDIGGYVLCQGPGSLLGIRLTAMAIRTWKAMEDDNSKTPAYTYSSLAALEKIIKKKKEKMEGYLVRPIRQNAWIVCEIANSLERRELTDEQMKGLGDKVFGMRGMRPPPCPQYKEVTYSIDQLKGNDFLHILSEVKENNIDAEHSHPQTFKKWDGKRHKSKLL